MVSRWSEDATAVVRVDAGLEGVMSDSPVWLVTASDEEGAGGSGSATGVLSASIDMATCS